MKNLIVLAIAGAILSMAAKYFKISSWEDVKKMVPDLKSIVPNLKDMVSKN